MRNDIQRRGKLLYISCRLSRLMDGDIDVDNAPQGGARYTVTLPFADDIVTP